MSFIHINTKQNLFFFVFIISNQYLFFLRRRRPLVLTRIKTELQQALQIYYNL